MKLFAKPFLRCFLLLSWQMALAAHGPRLRERWRLRLRMRVGAPGDATATPAPPAVRASLRETPSGFGASTTWEQHTTAGFDEVINGSRNQDELDKLGDRRNQEVIYETLGYKRNEAAIDKVLGESGNQSKVSGRRDLGEEVDKPLYGRSQDGAENEIDNRENQTEIRDEIQDDNPDQSEVLGKQNQNKIADEGTNRPNQNNVLDKVPDSTNQSEIVELGGSPGDSPNQSGLLGKQNEDKIIDEGSVKPNQHNVTDNRNQSEIVKPDSSEALDIDKGGAIDKILYNALMDKGKQSHLDKTLLALGIQDPGEDVDKALDAALFDENPSAALDRALHESLSIREDQGEVDQAINYAVNEGKDMAGSFEIKPDLEDGNDYRRTLDSNEVDAAKLYDELSINGTVDDVISKVIEAVAAGNESSAVNDSNGSTEPITSLEFVNDSTSTNATPLASISLTVKTVTKDMTDEKQQL